MRCGESHKRNYEMPSLQMRGTREITLPFPLPSKKLGSREARIVREKTFSPSLGQSTTPLSLPLPISCRIQDGAYVYVRTYMVRKRIHCWRESSIFFRRLEQKSQPLKVVPLHVYQGGNHMSKGGYFSAQECKKQWKLNDFDHQNRAC